MRGEVLRILLQVLARANIGSCDKVYPGRDRRLQPGQLPRASQISQLIPQPWSSAGANPSEHETDPVTRRVRMVDGACSACYRFSPIAPVVPRLLPPRTKAVPNAGSSWVFQSVAPGTDIDRQCNNCSFVMFLGVG
jgi:hypothetical protein